MVGIEICKGWLDTTATLGAPSMRVNSGAGDFAACVASLKECGGEATAPSDAQFLSNWRQNSDPTSDQGDGG